MSEQSFLDRLADPKQVLAVLREAGWTYEKLTNGIVDGIVEVPESEPLKPEGDQ